MEAHGSLFVLKIEEASKIANKNVVTRLLYCLRGTTIGFGAFSPTISLSKPFLLFPLSFSCRRAQRAEIFIFSGVFSAELFKKEKQSVQNYQFTLYTLQNIKKSTLFLWCPAENSVGFRFQSKKIVVPHRKFRGLPTSI